MASSDISRYLHQPHKRYVGVRLQQGRLLTDADFNEHARLGQEELHQYTSDLLGPKASPDHGFSLGLQTGSNVEPLKRNRGLGRIPTTLGGVTFNAYRFWIRPGTLYLAGHRFELFEAEQFVYQRDFLQMRREHVPALSEESVADFAQFYLLHAWEQEVSTVEDDEIRDPALGGRDTSTRLIRMRRVEGFGELPPGVNSVDHAWSIYRNQLESGDVDYDATTGELRSRGRLQIGFDQHFDDFRCRENCTTSPGRKMLGAANLTLRILLTARDRYVWALDNAAPIFRVLVRGLSANEGNASPTLSVEMLTPPIDETGWPTPGRVVEILPIAALLDGTPVLGTEHPHFKKLAERVGTFFRVGNGYDPSNRSFELEAGDGLEELRHCVTTYPSEHPDVDRLNFVADDGSDAKVFYCRFWHDASNGGSVHIPLALDDWGQRLGDTGVIPVFHAHGRRGDYWTVALRPESNRRVVPFDLAAEDLGVPPHGPRDFYMPLALVTGSNNVVEYVADARPVFSRAIDTGCVSYTVGDTVQSHGDFKRIQDAIDALNPELGGRIVVRRGTYRELLKIKDTQNLVLEACGEQVVIETPLPADPPVVDPELEALGIEPALIDIVGSRGISISGFHLNAIEQRAVRTRGMCSQIALSVLTCRAGLRQGWAFVPGARRNDVPLVDLANLVGGSLTGLVLEPASRQALHAFADSVTIRGLTALNEPSSSETPTTPLVALDDCTNLLFEDSVLTAHGRVALSVSLGSEITLRGLAVVASQHRNRLGRRTQSQAGIDIEGAELVRLISSWITLDESPSDSAAVVVKGRGLSLVSNHIEVLARCFESPSPSPPSPDSCTDLRVQAWGGVQIRGDSRDIELRENQILGGVGHGITLGSVVWREPPSEGETEPSDAFSRFGAGYGQMARRIDGHLGASGKPRARVRGRNQPALEPYDEGTIYDLRILSNRIEQMNGSGISVVTVLGFPDAVSLIDTVGLKISDNTIVDNLRHPADNIELADNFVYTSDTLMRTATSSSLLLPGQTARASTPVSVLPLGGIVLGSVTALDISGNVIVGNGHVASLPTNGIFVLIGEGIRIVNNRIAGNGRRARIDSPEYSPPPGPDPGVRAGIAILLGGTGIDLADSDNSVGDLNVLRGLFDGGGVGLDDGGSSVRILGNTIRHPEGRALHIIAAGPVAIVGNFLSSEGNHGADTFQDAYMVGDAVYVHNLGAPFEAAIGEATSEPDLDLTDRIVPPGAEAYLDFSAPTQRQAVFGHGGPIQFKDNQVTFDWEVLRVPHLHGRRAPLAYFPVALICLDHLSLDGNQFAFRLRGRRIRTSPPTTSPALFGYVEPVFGQVLGIGGTVQTSNNRCSETVGSAILSLVTIGKLSNLTTFNQCTHEILAVTEAYDTVTQVAALKHRYQGDWTEHPTVNMVSTVAPFLTLSYSFAFGNVFSFNVTVVSAGSGGYSPGPQFEYVAKRLVGPNITGTFEWAPEVELDEVGVRIFLPTGSYALNAEYSFTLDRVKLMAEGTNPPPIYALYDRSDGTAFAPDENAELEIRITAAGVPSSEGDSPVQFRWRRLGGEAWSPELDLNTTTTIAPSGTQLARLDCTYAQYQTDAVYRLSVYRGVSKVRSQVASPSPTVGIDSEDGTPQATERVIVDVLQGGTINSAAGDVPEFRYSVDGGRSWSPVAPLNSSTKIGESGVTLDFQRLMQRLEAKDLFEFQTFVPPLSREVVSDWLIRMGNQVLFRPHGTDLNLTSASRLISFSRRFLSLLSRVSS